MTPFMAGTTCMIPRPIPCWRLCIGLLLVSAFCVRTNCGAPCCCDVVRGGACFNVCSSCLPCRHPACVTLPLFAVRLLWFRLGGQLCHPAESAHQLHDPPAVFVVVQALQGVALFCYQSVLLPWARLGQVVGCSCMVAPRSVVSADIPLLHPTKYLRDPLLGSAVVQIGRGLWSAPRLFLLNMGAAGQWLEGVCTEGLSTPNAVLW